MLLHGLDQGDGVGGVKGNVGALGLSAQVLDLLWVLLGKLLHLGVRSISDAGLLMYVSGLLL